jgi:hypothetical protein
MRSAIRKQSGLVLLAALLMTAAVAAWAAAAQPPLFFREDWKETPAELPVSQAHVANPDLQLQLYGPGLHGIKKSNHPPIPNDPYYIWSGACPGNWAVTLKHRSNDVDLRGPALVRWRTRQSGFRQLRIILKTADGKWFVSDVSDGASDDWHVREFAVASIHWRSLDISRVSEGQASVPDLSRVQEIGFSDLMTGGLSDACSRLDWMEVYGTPVPR